MMQGVRMAKATKTTIFSTNPSLSHFLFPPVRPTETATMHAKRSASTHSRAGPFLQPRCALGRASAVPFPR